MKIFSEFEKRQAAKILSCYGDSLEKGGEGSRGGKVIGHTKSGKPIYQSTKDQHDFHSFTKDEHADAAEIHKKILDEIPEYDRFKSNRQHTKKYANHLRAVNKHGDFSKIGEQVEEKTEYGSIKNLNHTIRTM